MPEKTIPWWRKALNFALGGIRSGFGLLFRPAKVENVAEFELYAGLEEGPEEETRLTDSPANPEIMAAEREPLVAAVEAAPEPVAETAETPVVFASEPVATPEPEQAEPVAEAVVVAPIEAEDDAEAVVPIEPEAVVEPGVAPVVEEVPERHAEAEAEVEVELEPAADVAAAAEVVAPIEAEAVMEPAVVPEVEEEPEPHMEANAEVEAERDPRADAGAIPEVVTPIEAEDVVDLAPELATSAGADLEAELEPEMEERGVELAAEGEPAPDAEAELEREANPGIDQVAEQAAEAESVSQPVPGIAEEQEAGRQAVAESEAEPVPKSEAQPGPLPEPAPEPEPDAEAETIAEEAEPVPEAEPAPGQLVAEPQIEPVPEPAPAVEAVEEAEPATIEEVVQEPGPTVESTALAAAELTAATDAEAVAEPAPPAIDAKEAARLAARQRKLDEGSEQSPFSVIVGQVYDGPMDLLLDLIRKQDIDIYDIPIAIITAQFLAYVNQLKASDVDVAGEFIYTASLLIHIKSKMLLPRAPSGPEDTPEDPRRELVERLLEHERFKNAAQMLQQKQMLEAASWTNPGAQEFKDDDAAEPEIAADTVDLVRIFRDILERARKRPVIDVTEDSVTVGQMIQFLARRLTMEDRPVALRRLLSHTRSERALIAMFLALLELVRLQAVLLRQDRAFSEIFVKKHTGFDAVMNEGLLNARDDWR